MQVFSDDNPYRDNLKDAIYMHDWLLRVSEQVLLSVDKPTQEDVEVLAKKLWLHLGDFHQQRNQQKN
ncbi:MAG: hypothetical protein KIT27_08355 [Legionellales bacterium]|nr:hypothetical protein [Legionellales bacterium]